MRRKEFIQKFYESPRAYINDVSSKYCSEPILTHCNIFEVTFDFPYRDSFIHGTFAKLCPGGASFKHMVVRKTRILEVEFETKLRLAAQNDTFNYSQIYVGGGGISLKVEFRSGSKPTEEYSKARSNMFKKRSTLLPLASSSHSLLR